MTNRTVLNEGCVKFLSALHKKFENRRQRLLQLRRQPLFHFAPDTANIRNEDWQCAPALDELNCCKAEVVGEPTDKIVIDALNSDADVFIASFEDSCSPTWENLLRGQQSLLNANSKTISVGGEKLNESIAVLMVHPRGLHMTEKHMFGISASLFDYGVYLYNSWAWCMGNGSRPYFYLPKLEHGDEAFWWNDVMNFSEEYFGMQPNTIRCAALIETLPAAFQMDEILYRLKDRVIGLSCGRAGYIHSFLKASCPVVMPDKESLYTGQKFLARCVQMIVNTCNKRGATHLRCEYEDITKKMNMGDLLCNPTGDTTTNGLRQNIIDSLEYLTAWLSGDGHVSTNNVIHDFAIAEISRTQIWQWVNQEEFDEQFVLDMIHEELGKLIAGNNDKKVFARQACDVLKESITKHTLDDFISGAAYTQLLKNEEEGII